MGRTGAGGKMIVGKERKTKRLGCKMFQKSGNVWERTKIINSKLNVLRQAYSY
jgi:hypothetical protein